MIFLKCFLKHQECIKIENNPFLGCFKHILSHIWSTEASVGIIFGNFDAYGLQNAYFITEKTSTMMKSTIKTKWGMPFFSMRRTHDLMCVRFP